MLCQMAVKTAYPGNWVGKYLRLHAYNGQSMANRTQASTLSLFPVMLKYAWSDDSPAGSFAKLLAPLILYMASRGLQQVPLMASPCVM